MSTTTVAALVPGDTVTLDNGRAYIVEELYPTGAHVRLILARILHSGSTARRRTTRFLRATDGVIVAHREVSA